MCVAILSLAFSINKIDESVSVVFRYTLSTLFLSALVIKELYLGEGS